jgi:hypothetical protein
MFGYSDPIYQVTLGFTVMFVTVVLYKATKGIYFWVKKENDMDSLEAQYDRLRAYRQDLKVNF